MFYKMSLALLFLSIVAAAVGCSSGSETPAQNLATVTPTAAATSAVSDPILDLPGGTIHASAFAAAIGLTVMQQPEASTVCDGTRKASDVQWVAALRGFINGVSSASSELFLRVDATAQGDPNDIATARTTFVAVCKAYGY